MDCKHLKVEQQSHSTASSAYSFASAPVIVRHLVHFIIDSLSVYCWIGEVMKQRYPLFISLGRIGRVGDYDWLSRSKSNCELQNDPQA